MCSPRRRHRRRGWARLLKRVFDLDLEHCPQCGGDMKIIAAIEEPEVIAKILMHLRLPARARPTLTRLGSACVEVRQLGSIQGRIVIESGVSLPETA